MKRRIVHFLRTESARKAWSAIDAATVWLFGPRWAAFWTFLGLEWGPKRAEYQMWFHKKLQIQTFYQKHEFPVNGDRELLSPEQVQRFINKYFFFPENGACSYEIEKFIFTYVRAT